MLSRRIRIGSRRSRLAMRQAQIVEEMLRAAAPSLETEIVGIATRGDEDWGGGPSRGKDAFVRAIEEQLLSGEIDLAVHSMKDLPAKIPDGLVIAAIPLRDDPRDALVSRDGAGLSGLAAGARIGTSSLRRRVQLLAARPDLEVVEIRGNVETRLRKLEEQGLDAVVLALSGLKRLGLGGRVSEVLATELMLPAPGQGALAVEARLGDEEAAGVAGLIDHGESRLAVMAERAFMERVGGGCEVPMAAYARLDGTGLVLEGMLAPGPDGRLVRVKRSGPSSDPIELGRRLAEEALDLLAEEV